MNFNEYLASRECWMSWLMRDGPGSFLDDSSSPTPTIPIKMEPQGSCHFTLNTNKRVKSVWCVETKHLMTRIH